VNIEGRGKQEEKQKGKKKNLIQHISRKREKERGQNGERGGEPKEDGFPDKGVFNRVRKGTCCRNFSGGRGKGATWDQTRAVEGNRLVLPAGGIETFRKKCYILPLTKNEKLPRDGRT